VWPPANPRILKLAQVAESFFGHGTIHTERLPYPHRMKDNPDHKSVEGARLWRSLANEIKEDFDVWHGVRIYEPDRATGSIWNRLLT
jgi:hypothetical protein